MAIATAGAVLLQAAGLLNDAAQTSFTNAVLLPYLRIAFDELQIALDGYQLPFVKRESAPVTVAAGATTITAPTDMIRPINLLERLSGSTSPEDYDEMAEINWDPRLSPNSSLGFWAWVGTAFVFPAASTTRQVIVQYVAALTDIVDAASSVQLQRIHIFLQYRTAALAAEFIMQDTQRADGLNVKGAQNLDAILRAAVRSRQATPAMRKPFRYGWNKRIRRRLW